MDGNCDSAMHDSPVRMSGDRCTVNLEDQKLLEPEITANARLFVEFNDLSYTASRCKGDENTLVSDSESAEVLRHLRGIAAAHFAIKCRDSRAVQTTHVTKVPENACGHRQVKKILQNVSGCFRPGRMTAIIGPSGAGKSSLLGILSTIRSVNVKGTILVNGQERNRELFRKQTSFIPQEFALLPLLTARETLYIAARLKLNRSDKSRTAHLVTNEIAENLGLTSCLDTLVEKLSGGERKRLSIGVEIITKPSLLLLDEPTSGLDSASSNQVITLLHDMARAGCTIVCAVHQPSCRMISLFDDVLVLNQGKCFYCGPWGEVLSTFETANYNCPQFYNIAEFVLEVITGQRGGNLDNLYEIAGDKYLKWRTQYQHPPPGTNSSSADCFDKQEVNNFANNQDTLSGWQQQKVLFLRAMICVRRDSTMTKLRLVAHVIVAFLLGVVFYDSGNNASRTSSNIASIFFILLFLYFASSMPAVQMLPTEAAVFLREYMNNWYHLRSYYIVKLVSDLPLQILCPTTFISITYYMTGQPMECQRFFQTWIICFLMTCLGQSSGILTGIAFNTQIGVFLIPALSMPMILFAGFFLKFNEMTFYLQPLCTISFFRYAFEGILLAIYGGDRKTLPCSEIYCFLRTPKQILDWMNMPTVSYHTAALMLGAWIVCLQILIYSILKWKAYTAKK